MDRTPRVLVVDDDPRIRRTLDVNIRARGYVADYAATGEQALTLAARHHPDVVVLDLGLPTMEGLDVVRGLRGWSDVPIVVLSGRDSEAMKVESLDLGADDYVTKPFAMDELFARLRAAIRRREVRSSAERPVLTTADFTVDFPARQVVRDGRQVPLTPRQWQIVEVLARNAARLVTHEQLLREVWGPSYGRETNYLRVFMSHIRRRLEPDPRRPRYFITEPGMGFRFLPGDPPEGSGGSGRTEGAGGTDGGR